MEENDVKSICGGTKLEFKIQNDEKLNQNLTSQKFLIQNPTRCFFFNSESSALFFSQKIKIRRPGFFLQTQNMIKSCCQNLAGLSYALSASKNSLFETDNDWYQKAFLWVCGICLSHICCRFLPIAFFMTIGLLMGVMILSFALPICLYKPVWGSNKVLLAHILFWKILKYCYNYHVHLEKI